MNFHRQLHRAGKTQRYHSRPEIGHFNQSTGDHSWGVVTLLVTLFPDSRFEAVMAAHWHDAGEIKAGDLPHPFKKASPYIAKRHARTEFRLAREMGVPQYVLTDEEKKRQTLCDWLEAHLYVRIVRPDIYEEEDWVQQRVTIVDLATELGVDKEVREML